MSGLANAGLIAQRLHQNATQAHEQHCAETRRRVRRELAADLLVKLVESNPQDREYNVRTAVEYTDALLDELDKETTMAQPTNDEVRRQLGPTGKEKTR